MIYFFKENGMCIGANSGVDILTVEELQKFHSQLDFENAACSFTQDIDKVYYCDGEVCEKPSQPFPYYTFNYGTKQWEDPRTLSDIKQIQRDIIKQSRTQAEYAGFIWDGSTFDSNAESQARITGAVTLALLTLQLSQPYEVTWTLADDTFRTLDASEVVLIGLALGSHVQTIFSKGQMLQAQIDASITKEEVEAITW